MTANNGRDTYALAKDEVGQLSAPGVRNLKLVETIHTVQSIDWGSNHCVFVDRQNRTFTFGSNRYGKLGSGEPELESETESSTETEEQVASSDEEDLPP